VVATTTVVAGAFAVAGLGWGVTVGKPGNKVLGTTATVVTGWIVATAGVKLLKGRIFAPMVGVMFKASSVGLPHATNNKARLNITTHKPNLPKILPIVLNFIFLLNS